MGGILSVGETGAVVDRGRRENQHRGGEPFN